MKNAWKSPIVGAVLIVLLTAVAYLPVMHGGFIWDDDSWTTGILGLLRGASGLRRMWCQPTALQQYYPLSGTTFWLDYHLWGFRTLPYHVENVLLHAVSAVLFWQLLRRLEMPGAWLAGAVFALHPVMVESAGWITERKNVLSLALYLGALLAYGRFRSFSKEDSGSSRYGGAYGLALVLCLGALLAKTTAFSLPAVILLIGWWKRGRIRWREDVLPTLPMFAMVIGLCLMTAWLERTHVGAQGPEFALTFPERCLIAGRAIWFYIGKLLWPVNLCFVYPRWQPDDGSWQQWLYPAAAVGVLVALWAARPQIGRGPVTAAFFFVGTLFPLLGFFNAYGMRYSFVWNHWVYLPSLSLIALAAALATRAAVVLRAPRVGVYGVAASTLAALGALTWGQAHVYQDVETLWQDTIAKNPACWMAYNNLGLALHGAGNVHDAIASYQQSLQIKGDDAEAHYNLGNSLVDLGKIDDAIAEYEQALRIQPDFASAQNRLAMELVRVGKTQDAITRYQQSLLTSRNPAEAHYDFGNFLLQVGRVDDAIAEFEEVVRLRPDSVRAQNNLGVALARSGRIPEAMAHYQEALHIDPDDAEAHYNLGNAYQQVGDVPAAISQYEEAVWIDPHHAEAHNNLGNLLMQEGRLNDAATEYERAVQIQPDSAAAESNLGLALARLGNVRDAITHFREALRIDPKRAEAHYNLGNALQQIGNVPDAIAQYQDALKIDPHDADAHEKLGLAFLSVGRFQEAADQLQEALQIKPDLTEAQTNLAWLVETKGVEPSTSAMPLRRSPN